MTDELVTDLGQISARVISRTSVMPYKRARKPLGQIARELNVDAVVEGTVLRSRNQVRITAQLIEARADKHRGVSSRRAVLRQNRLLDLPCQQHRNLSCENRDQRRAFTVPDALGNKIIHPYGNFLLHNIGTGDGIVQNPPQDTANKLRALPLWGLRMHPRHMHDPSCL